MGLSTTEKLCNRTAFQGDPRTLYTDCCRNGTSPRLTSEDPQVELGLPFAEVDLPSASELGGIQSQGLRK